MGLFKKLVGDIAKTVGESLEEVSNEAKKSFQEAREEVRKNIQEAKLNQSNDDDDNWDYPLTKLSDEDDDIRIQLGHFKKWRFNHRRETYNSRRRCLGGVQ